MSRVFGGLCLVEGAVKQGVGLQLLLSVRARWLIHATVAQMVLMRR